MARLHTTAIFCSCQFLIFSSRSTFRHSAYSESDRRARDSPRPPRLCGGLKFAKCRPISCDFRLFLSKWRTNYFHFRFSIQNRTPRGGLYRKLHILILYLGEFSRHSGSKLNLWLFFCFFVKMAAKTISVSGCNLKFKFLVLDFIKNIIHINMVCRGLFKIYGVKIQKLFKWVTKNFHSQFFDLLWWLWSSIIWPKISKIGIHKTQKSHFFYAGT